jgi:hypothetical protein
MHEIEGEVGRDVEARGERVLVLPGARVGGALLAYLPERDRLEVAGDAVIAGGSRVEELDRHGHTIWSRYRDGRFYTWTAVCFVASFLIGLILHAIAPSWFAGRIETGRDFVSALGLGCAFAVLCPLALLLLALTVVGIPLALIGLAAWARPLPRCCRGGGGADRSLVKPQGDSLRSGMALAVGLVVVVLLRNLPFVGGPAGWVIALVGVGMLVAQSHAAWRRSRPTW